MLVMQPTVHAKLLPIKMRPLYLRVSTRCTWRSLKYIGYTSIRMARSRSFRSTNSWMWPPSFVVANMNVASRIRGLRLPLQSYHGSGNPNSLHGHFYSLLDIRLRHHIRSNSAAWTCTYRRRFILFPANVSTRKLLLPTLTSSNRTIISKQLLPLARSWPCT